MKYPLCFGVMPVRIKDIIKTLISLKLLTKLTKFGAFVELSSEFQNTNSLGLMEVHWICVFSVICLAISRGEISKIVY